METEFIDELIKGEFPLNDSLLQEQVKRVIAETIKFFENPVARCQQNELNKTRNEIEKTLERIKENFDNNNVRDEKEKKEFGQKILTLLIELSALSVKKDFTDSVPSINSSILRIILESRSKKALREILYNRIDRIDGFGIKNKIEEFYRSCYRIFQIIKITSLYPNLFLSEILGEKNLRILKEIINEKGEYRQPITEDYIKKIESKIAKKI